MSNRIIKDFKGWSLINEAEINPPNQPGSPDFMQAQQDAETAAYPAEKAAAAAKAAADAADIKAKAEANAVAAANVVSTIKATSPVTANTKANSAPLVPTPDADLTAAKAGALTRNDWAAIQTKLNAANLALQQATLDNQANPANFDKKPKTPLGLAGTVGASSTYGVSPTYIPQVKESRSFTKLYEDQLAPLVVDGLVGPKTRDAVTDFVTKYNSNPDNIVQLPIEVATATTINPQILAAILAAGTTGKASVPAPIEVEAGQAGPEAIVGSEFGPLAHITEADFAVESSIDTRKYNQTNYSIPATKLLLAAAKMFYDATWGPGTNPDGVDTSILMCKTASDFYKLNAVIKNVTGTDIQFIINDEYEGDNIDEVISLNTELTALNVQSSYETNGATGDSTRFKEKSFIITIPGDSTPDTVFPPAVYKFAGEQSMVVNNQPKANLLYAKP